MNNTELLRRLKRYYQVRPVDIDALLKQAEQEQRTQHRRAWGAAIAAVIAVLGLLPACFARASQAPQTYVTTQEQQSIRLDAHVQ